MRDDEGDGWGLSSEDVQQLLRQELQKLRGQVREDLRCELRRLPAAPRSSLPCSPPSPSAAAAVAQAGRDALPAAPSPKGCQAPPLATIGEFALPNQLLPSGPHAAVGEPAPRIRTTSSRKRSDSMGPMETIGEADGNELGGSQPSGFQKPSPPACPPPLRQQSLSGGTGDMSSDSTRRRRHVRGFVEGQELRNRRLSLKAGMALLRNEADASKLRRPSGPSGGDKSMFVGKRAMQDSLRQSSASISGDDGVPCPADEPPFMAAEPSWITNEERAAAGPKAHALELFVRSMAFDYLSCILVLLNAILLGVQTDWEARNVGKESPQFYRIIEFIFCALFTAELLIRVRVYGKHFFVVDFKWNVFDVFLVTTQLVEVGITIVLQSAAANTNFTMLRMLRIMRLIRIMRLMRVLRLVEELRTLVLSIGGSLRALVWAIMLLFVMMYVIGVYLTQVVADHRVGNLSASSDMRELVNYWGSLGDAIYSLYQAVTGGADWGDLVAPLRSEISVLLAPLFMMYIAGTLLCMLNVITGVFVESALLTAKVDKDMFMVNHVRNLFKSVDVNRNGSISWVEFEKTLANPEMIEVFKQVDMDVSEAESLFQLLDIDETGTIDVNEFISGCNRLRGPAKSLDLSLLGREVERIGDRCAHLGGLLEAHAQWAREVLPGVMLTAAHGGGLDDEV